MPALARALRAESVAEQMALRDTVVHAPRLLARPAPKLKKTGRLYRLRNVGRPKLWFLYFFLDPKFLVDGLCGIGVWVQKLHNAISLARTTHQLFVEQQTVGVFGTVVLIVLQPAVKVHNICQEPWRDLRRRQCPRWRSGR